MPLVLTQLHSWHPVLPCFGPDGLSIYTVLTKCLSDHRTLMAELQISDDEAVAWFASNEPTPTEVQLSSCPGPRRRRRRRPRLHLVLGDSVAKRASITSRYFEDKMLNRSQGGETWSSLLERLDLEISAWQTAAAALGIIPGSVVIWLTGNDVYSKESGMANFNLDQLFRIGRSARAAVMRLRRAADRVTILGPLPRLAGEVWGRPGNPQQPTTWRGLC